MSYFVQTMSFAYQHDEQRAVVALIRSFARPNWVKMTHKSTRRASVFGQSLTHFSERTQPVHPFIAGSSCAAAQEPSTHELITRVLRGVNVPPAIVLRVIGDLHPYSMQQPPSHTVYNSLPPIQYTTASLSCSIQQPPSHTV
jgi:hypothetical protein